MSVTTIEDKGLYPSLDLIVLDMLAMSLISTPLERIFFLRRQRFLREGLSSDLLHYTLNHLLMGGLLVLIAIPGTWIKISSRITGLTLAQSLPAIVQAIIILFCADFCQYWVHRFFHNNHRLWQFHKFTIPSKNGLIASSRLHIIDVLVTRTISYVPIVFLGFSQEAFQLYLPIVALQALFVHSNMKFTFGLYAIFWLPNCPSLSQ